MLLQVDNLMGFGCFWLYVYYQGQYGCCYCQCYYCDLVLLCQCQVVQCCIGGYVDEYVYEQYCIQMVVGIGFDVVDDGLMCYQCCLYVQVKVDGGQCQ